MCTAVTQAIFCTLAIVSCLYCFVLVPGTDASSLQPTFLWKGKRDAPSEDPQLSLDALIAGLKQGGRSDLGTLFPSFRPGASIPGITSSNGANKKRSINWLNYRDANKRGYGAYGGGCRFKVCQLPGK